MLPPQRYRAGPALGGRPGRVAGPPSGSSSSSRRIRITFPVVRAPARQLRGRSDAQPRQLGPRVGGDLLASTGGPLRLAAWNRSPTIFGQSGGDDPAVLRRRVRLGCPERPDRAGDAALHKPDGFVSPSWFVLLRRTVTSTPSPSATSVQRRALTSLRRIPAMKRSPAITVSRRPRSRATGSDSTPRPRRRGRWQVARTAARSAAPNGRACPRPRSPAVRR